MIDIVVIKIVLFFKKEKMYNKQYSASIQNETEKYLMKDLVDSITKENFSEKIEMGYFKKQIKWFVWLVKNSALRKVYDSYLDICDKSEKEYEIEKQIWIAKLAYQEKRKNQGKTILPAWFTLALKKIENKLWKDLFKKFMEVLIAYHKYLWGKE